MKQCSDVIKKIGKRNLVSAFVVIFFFVAVILTFYVFMYSSVKENIILRGEKTAFESAEKFDRYITTSSNLLMLEKKYIDQLIEDQGTQADIQNYLVKETERIQETVNAEYTGLYGYIMDEYHDGANWVPDDDYIPTERPWYKEALAKPGELVVIQPYVDAQTNSIVTTIAITLEDGKSVVALDISFDMIQTVTDKIEEGTDESFQVIVDNRGNVVAHSVPEEIGHNYFNEEGTFGSLVAHTLYNSRKKSFELKYGNTKYMIYSIPLSNGWFSISINDMRKDYIPLNTMVLIMLLILIAVVTILTVMFVRSNQKSIKADKLNHQLATTANVYMSVIDIDIINDRAEQIKSTTAPIKAQTEDVSLGAQEIFFRIFDRIPEGQSKSKMKDFVNFQKLEKRLENTDTVSKEYISFGNKWCRARFIVSERTEDGKLSHVLWMVEDIDEEKRSRDELKDISEKAVAASEAKSAFLSNMSHEIRTPINAVLGLNEMILRECDDKDILSYSSSINTAGHTLLGIVNDILDFSKIEAGKLEIIPVDYSLSSMLNDLALMVHTRADEKGLLINIKVDSKIPERLHGDEIRIKQVITNILTNAVKYTEKGSVTFSVDYEYYGGAADEILLKVSVEDTGIGIKEEDMEKLFSEFDRIEEKRNRNIEGTGLGMSITKSLLEMMGSELKVESEYGKGSRFSFEVIQKVISHTAIGDYEKTYKEAVLKGSDYKEKFIAPTANVLVVDDTPLNLTVFKSLLKKTELNIDTQDRGIKAIKAACTKKYDIIFLDHMMPEMDGIETYKELMKREDNLNKDTPYVCLTANAISGAREQYIDAGFNDYLTKPIESEKLEEMLLRYLPAEKVIIKDDNGENTGNDDENALIPVELFDIGELDINNAMSHCGSAEIYMDILHSFVQMIDDCINEAEKYAGSGDLSDAAVKIHAIKSEMRTIGAYEIGDLAEKLEMAAKAGDANTLDKESPSLFSVSRELVDKLVFLKTEEITNDESLPDISEEELSHIYDEINTDVEEFEFDKVDELVDELKKHHIPDAHLEEVKTIYHMVENLDYDQIPDVIGNGNHYKAN